VNFNFGLGTAVIILGVSLFLLLIIALISGVKYKKKEEKVSQLRDIELKLLSVPNLRDRDNFEAIVKIMKSNSILMLYNLVESTIRVSMLDYYSSLNDKQLSFSQAIESIQKLWIKNHLNQINSNELNQKVFNMILNVINNNYSVEIERESFHLSGNADVKEMKRILETHGITYNNDSFRDFGGALLTIKNKRNYLAHGNISFEDNGGRFSIQDINELKNKTYQCLDYFISLINSAIINQEFMSQDI